MVIANTPYVEGRFIVYASCICAILVYGSVYKK